MIRLSKIKKYTKEELITKLQSENVTATGSYNTIKALLTSIEFLNSYRSYQKDVKERLRDASSGMGCMLLWAAKMRWVLCNNKPASNYSLETILIKEEESLLQSKGILHGARIDRTTQWLYELLQVKGQSILALAPLQNLSKRLPNKSENVPIKKCSINRTLHALPSEQQLEQTLNKQSETYLIT